MTERAIIKSLLGVLSKGSDDQRRLALKKLFAKKSDLALVAMIMAYHHLADGMKEEIAEKATRFTNVLPYLVRKGNKQSRFNCIEFVSRADSGEYGALLAACAADSDRKFADQALTAISKSVDSYVKKCGGSQEASEDSQSLAETRRASNRVNATSEEFTELRGLLKALLVAVETLGDHERGEIVDSLVKLGKHGDKVLLMELKQALGLGRGREALIRQMVHKPRTATVMLLFTMLESGSSMLRRLAERLLGHLNDGGNNALLIETLKAKGAKETSAIVRQTRSIPWLKQCSGSLNQLGDELVLAWVNEIEEMDVDLTRKIHLLRQCLKSRSEAVVSQVFKLICKHYTPAIRPVLIEYSKSDYEPLQYHALQALSRTQFTGKNILLKKQLRSDSNRIRNLAASTLVGDHFKRLATSLENLAKPARYQLGAMVRQADPGMETKLLEMMHAQDPRQRHRALRMMRYTGTTPALQPLILRMAQDADRKIRAAASRLLSEFATKESARLALSLLRDKDMRVRANAIEVVEAFGHDAFQRALLPQLKANEARIRANAAKAMFTLGSPLALRILQAMSSSRTVDQRISGVWAMANLKNPETIKLAFDVAKFEKNTGLQRRMLRIIDDAEDDLREVKFGSRPMRRVA